jgi:Heparinase II/III-like protein/Heparinase II/III N-terminus
MKGQLDRARRLARKPPRYLARRALHEVARETQRLEFGLARRGRGRLAPRRLPFDASEALDLSAANGGRLAPWAEAIAAVGADERLRARIDARARFARMRRLELFAHAPVDVGRPPRWHEDAHTGLGWDRAYHRRIDYRNAGRQSDVKVAWELSRMRHCVALAQRAAILGDHDAVAEIDADLADWRATNPVGWSVNWTCAMEVALRAVNLICADSILVAAQRPLPRRRELVASLYQHGWFLVRNLEISDLNGNHFVADAVGLIWLGRWFQGIGDGGRWVARGIDMAREAARDQILEDGLDHEGSLPYHVLVLEMFCVARVAAGSALADLDPVIARMLDAALVFVNSEGRVPDLGDDDGGRVLALSDAPSRDARRVLALAAAIVDRPLAFAEHPEDAMWLAGPERAMRTQPAAPSPPHHFGAGGIVILGDANDHVVWDVGPIGFRGRGGHGHVDAMSFEAQLGGCIAVRDSGTGSYTGDPGVRNELRDAWAHSVVTIDGRPYAQIGDADHLWVITGDAPPVVEHVSADDASQSATAHQRLSGTAWHRRELRWSPGALRIRDDVRAPLSSRVEARLQVPDDCVPQGSGFATARHAYAVEPPPGAVVALERCRASDRYGSVGHGRRIVVRWMAGAQPSSLGWRVAAAS